MSLRGIEVLSRKRATDLRRAGEVLAAGGAVLWDLYSPGLAVDGLNPVAREKLLELKGIPRDTTPEARPIVSTLPLALLGQVVDLEAYRPEVRPLLDDPRNLLPADGQALFFRLYARPHLPAPLVRIEARGIRTIVLLIHRNPALERLYYMGCRYKRMHASEGSTSDFLIAGSSANPTGSPAPSALEDVNERIRAGADLVIDLRGSPTWPRGRVPIVDLLDPPFSVLRDGVFDAQADVDRLGRMLRVAPS